ncbi:hypothetical protein V8F33_006984 [Rhypophila sp. PSN 637]
MGRVESSSQKKKAQKCYCYQPSSSSCSDRALSAPPKGADNASREAPPPCGADLPFGHGIMRRQVGDIRIPSAIAIALDMEDATKLKKKDVVPLFASLFIAAKAFVENPAAPAILRPPPALAATISALSATAGRKVDTGTGSGASIGPLSFLYSLRLCLMGKLDNRFGGVHSSVDWVSNISFTMFAVLFLILRSARLRWHKNSRLPLPLTEHLELPLAIDAFNAAAEQIEWGGMEMVIWLRDGKMWIDPRSEDEKQSPADVGPASSSTLRSSLEMKEIILLMEDLCLMPTWELMENLSLEDK